MKQNGVSRPLLVFAVFAFIISVAIVIITLNQKDITTKEEIKEYMQGVPEELGSEDLDEYFDVNLPSTSSINNGQNVKGNIQSSCIIGGQEVGEGVVSGDTMCDIE